MVVGAARAYGSGLWPARGAAVRNDIDRQSMRRVWRFLAEGEPFRGQPPVLRREILVEDARTHDAIGAEVPKIVSEFAPGSDQRHINLIGHRNRPDRSLGSTTLLVAIGDRHLARLMDRVADFGGIHPGQRRRAALRYIEWRRAEVGLQGLGDDRRH